MRFGGKSHLPSVPHLAESAFYAEFEHFGNTSRSSKLITGSSTSRRDQLEVNFLCGPNSLACRLCLISEDWGTHGTPAPWRPAECHAQKILSAAPGSREVWSRAAAA